MSNAFWGSYILLWTLVTVLMVLVVLLYRQFGLAYLASRDRLGLQGIDLGRPAPPLAEPKGGAIPRSWRSEGVQAHVVVFALPTCTVCADLAEDVADLPETWPNIGFTWIDGSRSGRPQRAVDRSLGWRVVEDSSGGIREAWDVSAVPFAFLLSGDGVVQAKQVANRGSDLLDFLVPEVVQHQPTPH